MAQSLIPHVRESVRRVAVVRINDLGLILPMHISSIVSPLTPSSLWEALSRCSIVACHVEISVNWRFLLALLAEEDGNQQEARAYEGGNQVYSTLRAAEHACVPDEVFIRPKIATAFGPHLAITEGSGLGNFIHLPYPTAAPGCNEDYVLCVVCIERPRVMLFLGCAHLCACEDCASLLVACPLCRAVGVTMRVYT